MLTLHKSGRSLEDSAPVLRPFLDAFTFDLVEPRKSPGQAFTQHAGGINLIAKPTNQLMNTVEPPLVPHSDYDTHISEIKIYS